MSIGWDSIPLLPLGCILNHLNTADALAATSVCRHWRTAIRLYEGRIEMLKLQGQHIEKSMFLARVFRKHVKRLRVHLDCSEPQLDKFLSYVLPVFFDSIQLQEVLFIGPSYLKLNQNFSVVKLNRVIAESLVVKHLHSLQRVAILGCEMDTAKSDVDGYNMHKQLEYYARPLSLVEPSPADSILSSCNVGAMMFSSLQHIAVDLEQINTEALETLSSLPMFSHLTLNIGNRPHIKAVPIEWERVMSCFASGLEITLNLFCLPYRKFDDVIANVLVEGMPLTSLKVMFCKMVYTPLIAHIAGLYKSTLKELVWVDSPYDSVDWRHRYIRPRTTGFHPCVLNPFILLCWQCSELRRLVVHGYWLWQYDVVGLVRLRSKLQLEVSAVYADGAAGRFAGLAPADNDVIRVLAHDQPEQPDVNFLQEVRSLTCSGGRGPWSPVPWSALPPALRPRAALAHRSNYLLQEMRRVYGLRSNDI